MDTNIMNQYKRWKEHATEDSDVLEELKAIEYDTSKIEDAKDGNIKYYLDENKDYVVPKRKLEDIVKYL